MNNIIVGIDFSECSLNAMIAKCFDATIHVLGVCTADQKNVRERVKGYVNQVVKFIKSNKVKYIIDGVHNNNEADGVIEYAKKINANLASIMDEQEKTAANIFAGSFAQQIVNNSSYPVLISHAKDLYSHLA